MEPPPPICVEECNDAFNDRLRECEQLPDPAECLATLPMAVHEKFGIIEATVGSEWNPLHQCCCKGREAAAEVLLDDGQAHLIRDRQTFEDLVRGESGLPGDGS